VRQSENDPGDRFLPNASAFGAQAASEPAISAADVEKLHAKIGQLVICEVRSALGVRPCGWTRRIG